MNIRLREQGHGGKRYTLCTRSTDDIIPITGDITPDNIKQKFQVYFNNIRLLNTELWPICCKVFQVSLIFLSFNLVITGTLIDNI